jgi:Ca2+-binding RTX toxin-like protein
VDHDLSAIGGASAIAKNTATGTDIAGAGKDTVSGFENVNGGGDSDVIYGNAAINVIDGGPGNDFLLGFAGNDTLFGGGDADTLVGGAGKDTLSLGGADASVDTVIYLLTTDSGITRATRDIILGFEDGTDKIDLSAIDANTTNGAAVNDSFTYINGDSSVTPGAFFTEVAGQLRSYWSADGHIIEGDVNGDGKADFSIEIIDPTHSAIVLVDTIGADFVL